LPKYKDEIGKQFGRLTVLSLVRKPHSTAAFWLCRCVCGKETIVVGRALRSKHTTSCGCFTADQARKTFTLPSHISGFRVILRTYKSNAKLHGREFSLTENEFRQIIEQPCFYCGKLPFRDRGDCGIRGHFRYNGIDRVDNSIGYISENCVPCCQHCNQSKLNYSLDEFRDWVKSVYKCFIQGENKDGFSEKKCSADN